MSAIVISIRPIWRITLPADHYRYPSFQGWQAGGTALRCEVCGDKAANEGRPVMAQEHRDEAKSTEQRGQVELSELELEQVTAAGSGVRITSDGANN
jgi:hypothetical protein